MAADDERAILDEFLTMLAIPSLAANPAGIRRNADAIVVALTMRGVDARLVEVPGVAPGVFGELVTPGATRTVIS